MIAIELDRLFIPIKPDGETIDWGAAMGRKYGGWLQWDELLTKRRVVLLAEAKSGKTEEFRVRASVLKERGDAAFFLRVEDLADGALIDGLTPDDEARFTAWQDSNRPGWFFLDSVDEARLNAKNFERALTRFRRDVGAALDRTHVLVSCRVSDWKGRQDLDLVTSLLPVPSVLSTSEEEDLSPDSLLLRPIFEERSRADPTDDNSDAEEPLTVVRLAELTNEQRASLARLAGVVDTEAFIHQIARQGLNTFAERPGDLLELAEYWKVHGRFATFAEMTSFAIMQKLVERDIDRPDAGALTEDRALHGAERIAAALTLGKALTLRVPGQDPDPTLAAGALDPADILPDWTAAERAALLRRGVFTPATYGRIRFHHRSTQEFLTAQWLRRTLENNCPRSEVMGLLFVVSHGVRTVVPSLRPAAAWLALYDVQVREELLDREPFELIRYGDPGSLPLSTRVRLLSTYADRQAAGEVTNDSVDRQSLWMFSEPALAPAIREAWARNTDPNFRSDLLSMVREGTIKECSDLAREQAFDTDADRHVRYMAITAMVACEDREGLMQLKTSLMSDPMHRSARDALRFAPHLFPNYLSRLELVHLIEEVQPARRRRIDGFPFSIEEFWQLCPPGERAAFLEELADLCLCPPFRDEYHRLSAKHGDLATELTPLAAEMASNLGDMAVPAALIKACAAIERSRDHRDRNAWQKLCDSVRARRDFHRDLFWFDVQEARRTRQRDVISYWDLGVGGGRLWNLTWDDTNWLLARIRDEIAVQDRRIALSVLVSILDQETLGTQAEELRALVAGVPELEADLSIVLSPPLPNPEHERSIRLDRKLDRSIKKQEAKAKQTWREFAARLRADSSHLRDPQKLTEWMYVGDLYSLTEWLSGRIGKGMEDGARHWALLNEVFGEDVVQAYRVGMKLLWRVTTPRSLDQSNDELNTIDWTHQLSWYAVGMEADEGEGWAGRLTADEAERAVLHAFSVGDRFSKWIEALASTYPDRLKPLIAQRVASEWASSSGTSKHALYGIAKGGDEFFLQMADLILALLHERPGSIDTFDIGLRVLARLPQSAAARLELATYAQNELRSNAEDHGWALRYLALLFICDPASGVESLEWWITRGDSDEERIVRGERAFAKLFSHRWPLLPVGLDRQPVEMLKRLTLLAYRTIRIQDDVHHEGMYTPDRRDDAQSGRSQVLEALLRTPGREAYDALRELAENPDVGSSRKRFQELARFRAERDAEIAAWSGADVAAFEKRHTAPAKTGRDLFRIACAILSDIQTEFQHADASSRLVLASAVNEQAVQQWLAEQFRLRAKHRFHVHREVEVADKKEPDLLLSSTTAPVEVAVEVKHSGKGWTVRDLEHALREQLVEAYLRPANRRYGILVITHHKARVWHDPETNAVLTFEQVMARLCSLAAALQRNTSGLVEVAVVGLDASART
jgi:hypothetical protein